MNYEYFEVENKMVILDTPFFKTCYYKYSMPAILFLLQIIKTLHARTVIGLRIYINISRNSRSSLIYGRRKEHLYNLIVSRRP